MPLDFDGIWRKINAMTKNIAKIVLAAMCSLGGFAAVGSTAGAASVVASVKHPTYPLEHAKRCRVNYVKRTERRIETRRVKVDGKWKTVDVRKRVKVHGKWRMDLVRVRYIACVYVGTTKIVVTSPTQIIPVTTVPVATATLTAPTTTVPVVTSTTVPVITTSTTTTTTTSTTTTTTIPPLPRPTVQLVEYDSSTTGLNGTSMPQPLVLQMQPYDGPGGGVNDLGAVLDLWMNAEGNVAGDHFPTGVLVFNISPAPWEQLAIWNNPNGTAGPQDCSAVVNTPTIEDPPAPPGTNSGCMIYFSAIGTYTITIGYVSGDPNYASVSDALTETVIVS